MFCYQCEETAGGTGCTARGVCGKTPEVSALQDLLLYCLMGVAQVALEADRVGIREGQIGRFTVKAAFSTLTNVNFDLHRFIELIQQTVVLRQQFRKKVENLSQEVNIPAGPANFTPASTLSGLIKQAKQVGLNSYPGDDPDILSLKHAVLFGIKGVAAYADHAQILGVEDDDVYDFVFRGLAAIQQDDLGLNDWVALALECGKTAFRAMELLDEANTKTYGHPVPARVPLGFRKGKAILISGHDLKDLEALLKQTQGTGINIYTHGEMISTHGYPELKRYPHFYGQYGTAWQKQTREFADFPGPILMTTNCLQRPQKSYQDNLFTSGLAGWPDIPHIADRNFKPLIDRARELPGFEQDHDGGEVVVGFARNAVLDISADIVEQVKNGNIRHFFLVGGCDGAKPGRDYYTRFVEQIPPDCAVLTLACGKYRFFNMAMGEINGIPRLLDVGQCNDAYSAVRIAQQLSSALNVEINELPLSIILSWYEQKAVCVLLALLYLGVRDIRVGPSLPAFISPNVLEVLRDNFNIMPIKTPEKDIQEILK
ncbi:MAG: hydroxylamine reductase [Desulfobacteraceae bacterium]|nr:MAG: hydroxylamine reductase [Desulfobacteraceae bacterium]